MIITNIEWKEQFEGSTNITRKLRPAGRVEIGICVSWMHFTVISVLLTEQDKKKEYVGKCCDIDIYLIIIMLSIKFSAQNRIMKCSRIIWSHGFVRQRYWHLIWWSCAMLSWESLLCSNNSISSFGLFW